MNTDRSVRVPSDSDLRRHVEEVVTRHEPRFFTVPNMPDPAHIRDWETITASTPVTGRTEELKALDQALDQALSAYVVSHHVFALYRDDFRNSVLNYGVNSLSGREAASGANNSAVEIFIIPISQVIRAHEKLDAAFRKWGENHECGDKLVNAPPHADRSRWEEIPIRVALKELIEAGRPQAQALGTYAREVLTRWGDLRRDLELPAYEQSVCGAVANL
jgi:predicted component of type VI protein secretion system